MKDRDRRSRRYRQLVDELAGENGRKHGWKKAVADRLGVTPSYITVLEANSDRRVGSNAIDRAVRGLGISPAFFDAPRAGSYRTFVVAPVKRPDATLEEAFTLAQQWIFQRRNPNAAEAREFALRVLHWANSELAAVAKVQADAKALVLSSDSDAVDKARPLAFALTSKRLPPK